MAKPTALITGASSGIGEALARLAAKDGHDLILVARRRDRLESLARALKDAHGTTSLIIDVDLTRADGPGVVKQRVDDAGLTVDVLVNNAGFGSNGAFLDQDLDAELSMIDLNVKTLVALTGLFAPAMATRGAGKILHIASTAGFQGGPFMATYYATKAFVVSFGEALSVELKPRGVTVTTCCPGPVATEFGARAGNDVSNLFKKGAVASADVVAAAAWRGLHRGHTFVVPGLQNKLSVFGTRLVPRFVTTAIAGSLNRRAD